MWQGISRFILKFRVVLLIILAVATGFMTYKAFQVKLTYGAIKLLPQNHPILEDYSTFQRTFGEDGNVMVLGIQTPRFFQLALFNHWHRMGNTIAEIDGIENVVSIAHLSHLVKNKEEKRFEITPVVSGDIKTAREMDSLKNFIYSLPFYSNLLYNKESGASVMAISFNRQKLDSKKRIEIVGKITKLCEEYELDHREEIHLSGLPFLRTLRTTKIADELKLFLILAFIITSIILFLLFRSFSAVFFSLLVVIVGVVWSLGLIVLLGHKITLLTGLIPSIIVVIGIPNCVYLLNKYHIEFRIHGNKIKALSRVIEKIGHVTFYTNLTTAIGFSVFYFTRSKMLVEFGAVAGIALAAIFLISLILIPVVFSFLPDPATRHFGYLDNRTLVKALAIFNNLSANHRPKVYLVSIVLMAVAVFGIFQITTNGYILDDVAIESDEYTDLKFFEQNFKGIMPFEILIDTKKRGAAKKLSIIRKVEEVQQHLDTYSIFSKTISIPDGLKYANQAFYNGKPAAYRLPSALEKNFVFSYLGATKDDENVTNAFTDSNAQVIRISAQVADIGSEQMPLMLDSLRVQVTSIISNPDYDVTYTGASLVAMTGYNFLIKGLLNSVALALLLIAVIIAYLFRSAKMLILALIPNLIPLLITAAIMGYARIPLKPSTVLIFSIAFGISVDFTIHFLAKFRQEFMRHNWGISKTVQISLNETGVSMIYTAITLFFGFIIFTASEFGGTINLGLLTSVTLVVALFANMILLPSLLISFEGQLAKRALSDSLTYVYDDEDIELDQLEIIEEKL